MRDNRNKTRRNSPHRINVLTAGNERVLGRLVNITISGLMYLGDAPQAVGTALRLRLPLPTMANGKTAIDVQGEVVWCGDDDNPRFHRVGIEIRDLGAEEGYIIETVLQRLHLVG